MLDDIIKGFRSMGIGRFFAVLGCSLLVAILIAMAVAGVAVALGRFDSLDDQFVGIFCGLAAIAYFVRKVRTIGRKATEAKETTGP